MHLDKNIATIEKLSVNLADKIKTANCTFAEIIKQKNGKNNLLIRKHSRPTLVYPEKNTLKTAQLLSSQKIFFKDTATVLIGIGLGHTAYEILRKMDKGHKLVIVEPVLGILKYAFQQYDFSKYLKDGSFYIATSKEEVAHLLAICDNIYVRQDWLTVTEPYVMMCEEYKEVGQYTIEVLNQIRCNTGTVMGAGHIIAENDIKNLPYVIRHRGVIDLKNKFKGKPAISVNTGPSLAKNIHLLKEVQDKVVIIAVAQSLRILLAYGIKPDFICTVDYGKVNEEHFKGLYDEKDVNLVCLNRTYAPIIKKWQGTKFIAGTPCPGFQDFTSVLQAKGFIEQGGSVSHMNLGLALHMGCDPILVIGQDFAYSSDNKSHIEHADASGKVEVKDGMLKWKVKDPRSSIKKGTHEMGQALYVEGFFGDDIMTNAGLASFIVAFEGIIAGKENKVIDCTEGGAYKKGTIRMTLETAINKYLQKTVNKSIIEPLKTLQPDYEQLIKDTTGILKTDIDNLNEIITNVDKGLETVSDIRNLIKKRKRSKDKEKVTKEIEMLLTKNANYSKQASIASSKNNLMSVSLFNASRQIQSRHLKVDDKNAHKIDKQDNLEIRINRNELILKAAKDSAEKLLPLYRKSLNTLERYLSTNDETLLCDYKPESINLKDADKYFKIGNWAHPLVDAEKAKAERNTFAFTNDIQKILYTATQMRNKSIKEQQEKAIKERRQDLLDYNELCEKAYKSGRDGKDFTASLNYLKKAEKLFNDKHKARWGLATTYYKLNNIDKACEYYDGLVKDFPEYLQFEFERGVIYLEKDIQQGMKHLQKLLAKTEYYDYFLFDLAKLYNSNGMPDKAKVALKTYVKKYPGNYQAKEMMDKLK